MSGNENAGPAKPLLAIYLNDHLAGSTGGLELARRLARGHRGTSTGAALDELAEEVREDRAELVRIIRTLGFSIARHKLVVAWAGEKLSRFKLNGRLLRGSPLSTLVELEAMFLGVQGKAAGWRTLRIMAGRLSRLDAGKLDELLDRANRQLDLLERLRTETAEEIARERAGGQVP
ncbi:hypothetical protein HUO13_18020 [Saccharopolyspora erythraea]|uniref:hypothetical protein n=1 Tax=Saccharopolyspora erythraea TaxID=1836 RepID=UPI001BA46221|nr:hypothetical protein [Saccharopolyspora erythraea]QUH02447.1 hypothetical protein HUO13_18020 [Saccharopolyspora erythraea]